MPVVRGQRRGFGRAAIDGRHAEQAPDPGRVRVVCRRHRRRLGFLGPPPVLLHRCPECYPDGGTWELDARSPEIFLAERNGEILID